MLKRLLTVATLVVAGATSATLHAQTDVTSTYLTNADFESSTPIASHLKGYGKDGTPYGFQAVDGWTSVVLAGDNSNASYPNSGMGGAVFAYGSEYQLQGGNKAAPATNPDGEATGKALGFFAVWGCGGYYYQNVTFPAGKYTLTFPIYNQSGTQANTTYTGFFPNSGTDRTVAINTTVGSWVNQTVSFTLTAETAGQIRLGYKSTGNGSGVNQHLFFDGVKIEYTAAVVKDVLETALAAANKANTSLSNSELAAAITNAQAVYDNANATQDEINAAAATLNSATELAMSAAGDVTNIFLVNPGFESCTETTTNAAAGASAAPIDIAGEWTQSASAAWSSSAVVSYGGAGQVNGASAPSADNLGSTGKTLGVSVGWGGAVAYQSVAVTLPAGVYTLKVNAYNNLSGVTQFKSLFGFIPSEGSSTLSTKTAFAYATWETDQVTFTLNDATTGQIQVGGQAISGGSGSNAKVFFDNIIITYSSFLAGAKAEWDEAVAAAEQAKTDNPIVTGEELTALNAELAKAEPTTVDGYNAATESLTAATTALTSAAASYNALAAANDLITAAGTLAYADEAKKPSIEEAATSAADAANKATERYTALRAYYESHALAEGVVGAVVVENAITNATDPAKNEGWTWTGSMNDPKNNESWTDADGTNTHSYFDGGNWSATGWTTTMEQTVTLEPGKYLLTAKGRASDGVTLTLSVGSESVELPNVNASGNVFDRGWGDASVEFFTMDEATILVKATTEGLHQWFSVSDFRLVKLREATAEELNDAACEDILAEAYDLYKNTVVPTANIGTGAFQYDAAKIATYNEYTDTYATTDKETLKAALKAQNKWHSDDLSEILNTIKAFIADMQTVNAPADGQLFNVVLTFDGWTYDQKAMTYIANDRTDAGLYNIQYKEAANKNLAQAFTFTKVEGNNYKMSQIDADGNVRYLSTGVPYSGNTSQIRTTTNADDALVVTVIPTATEGVYNLRNTKANQFIGSQDAGVYTVDSHIDFKIVETSKPSVTLNTSAFGGYGTVMLPFAVAEIPSGVKVYTCAEVDGTTLTLAEVDAIEANKPYIIEGAWDETLAGDAQGTALTYTEGLLTGVYAETPAPVGSWVLQNLDDKEAFYRVADGQQPTVPANKAYLTYEAAGANVRGLFFPGEGGEATGIAGLDVLTSGSYDAIYTANGVQVESLQKGLNIVVKDGKSYKIFVK